MVEEGVVVEGKASALAAAAPTAAATRIHPRQTSRMMHMIHGARNTLPEGAAWRDDDKKGMGESAR